MPAALLSMTRPVRLAIGIAVWGGVVFGSTQLHRLDLPLGHGICGPWGCAAEPEALLGYHAFWLAIVGPTACLTCLAAPPSLSKRIALGLLLVGALGLVALVAVGTVQWLRDGGAPRYALQRGLFTVATTPDLPFLPLAIAGGLGWLTANRSRAPTVNSTDASRPVDPCGP